MSVLRTVVGLCSALVSLSALAASSSDPLTAARVAMIARLASPAASSTDPAGLDAVRKRFECVNLIGLRAEVVSRSDRAATVLVDVDAQARLPVTHAPAAFPSNWLVGLRASEGRWRVERVWSAEAELAERLAAAPDTSARLSILAAEPRYVTPELARRLVERGNDLITKIRLRDAADLAELALTIAGEMNSRGETARALLLLARPFDKRQQYATARALHQAAWSLAEKAGDMALMAAAKLGIATDDDRFNKPVVEDGSEAYRLAVLAGDDRVAGAALYLLGIHDEYSGRYGDAIRKYTETAQRARRYGDPLLEAVATAETGVVYEYMNNHTLGLAFLRRGIELFRKAGDFRAVLLNLRNLADMEVADQLYADAERHLRESEELLARYPSASTSAFVAHTHASIAMARHDLAAAERFDLQAIDLGKKNGAPPYMVTVVLEQLADVRLRQKRYPEALSLAAEAAGRAKTDPVFDAYWHAQITRGKALLALGRIDEARSAYEASIAAIEQSRPNVPAPDEDQQLFLADKDRPYYEMFRTYIGHDPAEALLWVERARSRTLIEFLTSGHRKSIKSLSEQERAGEERIEKAIADENVALRDLYAQPSPDAAQIKRREQKLADLRNERSVLLRELYDKHPDLAIARGDVPLPSADEMRAAIPADTAVVEYVSLDDGAWIIAVTRDSSPRIYPLQANKEKLRRLADELSKAAARRDIRVFAKSRALYDLLLRPAAGALRGKSTICIVADAALRNLPFQMLQPADGTFLIQKHAVLYAPSLAFLRWRATHGSGGSERQLLALANPTVSAATKNKARQRSTREALGALPETESEVRALASIYGRAQTTLRIGAAATEKEFKRAADRYRILHLATHGMYDDADPMYSHLVLARTGGSDDEDGLLEAREIVDLDLHADLAVLSACETGRAEARGGEGMLGLSWAFLGAGCPATVVSMWSVDSAATARLMVDFHRRLAGGDSAPEALRHAEMALMNERRYHHPYYWAPFVVVGASEQPSPHPKP